VFKIYSIDIPVNSSWPDADALSPVVTWKSPSFSSLSTFSGSPQGRYHPIKVSFPRYISLIHRATNQTNGSLIYEGATHEKKVVTCSR
jgi:hypothetical protein